MKALKKIWKRISAPFKWLGRAILNPFKKITAFFREEPDDAPVTDSLQLAFEEPASFLEHIGALRKHLLRSVIVLIICAVVAFYYLPQLLDFISGPIDGLENLTAVDVTEPISVGMRVVLLGAFAVALPYFILEIFLFVGPALSRRAPDRPAVYPPGSGLFLGGNGLRLLLHPAYRAASAVEFPGIGNPDPALLVRALYYGLDVLVWGGL